MQKEPEDGVSLRVQNRLIEPTDVFCTVLDVVALDNGHILWCNRLLTYTSSAEVATEAELVNFEWAMSLSSVSPGRQRGRGECFRDCGMVTTY